MWCSIDVLHIIRHQEITKTELIMTSWKTSATGILCDRIITVSLNWYVRECARPPAFFIWNVLFYCAQCITYSIQLPTFHRQQRPQKQQHKTSVCAHAHQMNEEKKIDFCWTNVHGNVNEMNDIGYKNRQTGNENRPSKLFSRVEAQTFSPLRWTSVFITILLCNVFWTVCVFFRRLCWWLYIP